MKRKILTYVGPLRYGLSVKVHYPRLKYGSRPYTGLLTSEYIPGPASSFVSHSFREKIYRFGLEVPLLFRLCAEMPHTRL
jgi:hypothetical protein